MEEVQQLVQIQEKVRRQQYRLTSHAEQERESDRITREEIEEALLSHQAEVIESYPEDIRGRSCLVLGFAKGESPLHIVCGLGVEMLIIITVYRPDPEQWINWRVRRKTKL
ncbi:DUF4258 domain-containing protein [Dehalococcoidales bacterium]|nr:DUF4258 domain-containing protein [Dehalococcoidales bacterium]